MFYYKYYGEPVPLDIEKYIYIISLSIYILYITSDEPLYRHDSSLMNESKPNQTKNINSIPSGQQGSISVELIPGVNKRIKYRVSCKRYF